MIRVSEIYDELFKGDAIYYVDDSFIYTNESLNSGDEFKKKLKKLNEKLSKYSFIDVNKNKEKLPYDNINLNEKNINYKIRVHTDRKSSYISTSDTKTGYKYLKFLSRLASTGAVDFKTTFTDYEEINLKKKFDALITAINKEYDLCCELIQNNKGCKLEKKPKENFFNICKKCENKCNCKFNDYKEYFDKLDRFKRFFEYRQLILRIRQSDDALEEIKNDIKEIINGQEIEDDLFEIRLSILDNYLNDTTDDMETLKDIKKVIEELEVPNILNFNNEDIKELFFYNKLIGNDKKYIIKNVDAYKNIKNIVSRKINKGSKQTKYQKNYLKDFCSKLEKNEIAEYVFNNDDNNVRINTKKDLIRILNSSEKYKIFFYWSIKSKYLKGYILNTVVSLILNVELNKNLYILRLDKKPLNYYDIRLITAVRNSKLDINLIIKILKEYEESEHDENIDYTIFEAIYYFRIFVREPFFIDNLILIHKYTTELWENG